MPPLPSPGQVLRVALQWTDGVDTTAANVLYYRYSGGEPSSADCSSLAGDVVTAFNAHVALWGGQTELTKVTVTDLSSDMGGQGQATAAVPGTRGGDNTPGSAALLINYTIPRRYRGGKPRTYFPWGVASDLFTRQAWTSDFTTAASAAMTAIQSAIIGASAGTTTISAHVNVSYYSGFTVEGGTGGKRAKNVSKQRDTPQVDVIGSFSVNTRVGSQRRRNR